MPARAPSKIRNTRALLRNGDRAAREPALRLLDAVLQEVDAGKRIRELLRVKDGVLSIGARQWDLTKKRAIYLLGAGKACNAMAMAVCDILGDWLTQGIIAVKTAEPEDRYLNTQVFVGGGASPENGGLSAAEHMLALIDTAGPDDLFLAVFSGGSAALLAYPVEGITLEDELHAEDVLRKSGATTREINAVRRHISRSNGGRFAQRIEARGAELINLLVSDTVGDPPTADRSVPARIYGTMVAPDDTTIQDARDAIDHHVLRDQIGYSIVEYLWDDARVQETPKAFGERVTTFVLGAVPDPCEAAARVAARMGIPLLVLTTCWEGEGRELGTFLAAMACEIQYRGRPIAPPCFLVCSGQTNTRIIRRPHGLGGPSHEVVTSFAIGARMLGGISVASIDTEGTDGTTPYAGAVADTRTFDRLEGTGKGAYAALRGHATGTMLEALGDSIETGNTGTNLCSFHVVYVSKGV